MASLKQIEANRNNAERSTGPKTEAGKAQSRQNALKHGLAARVVAIPDEDPEATAERMADWQAELNPRGSQVLGYFVAETVRQSVQLDRCHVISAARTAQLARDAVKARKEARFRDVEACRRLFDTEPDVAVRRLRTTVEGIDHLLEEWSLLSLALQTDLPDWDKFDGLRMSKLRGTYVGDDHPGPDPSRLCTKALTEYRDVKSRLDRNEQGYWSDHYANESTHQLDRDRLSTLAATALQARGELIALIAREVEALRALRAELELDDRVDILEASDRSKFDISDDGKLLRRYEFDLRRGLFRSMEEIRKQHRTDIEPAEDAEYQEVTTPSTPEPGPPAGSTIEVGRARNEANLASNPGASRVPITLIDSNSTDGMLAFSVGKGPQTG